MGFQICDLPPQPLVVRYASGKMIADPKDNEEQQDRSQLLCFALRAIGNTSRCIRFPLARRNPACISFSPSQPRFKAPTRQFCPGKMVAQPSHQAGGDGQKPEEKGNDQTERAPNPPDKPKEKGQNRFAQEELIKGETQNKGNGHITPQLTPVGQQ